MRVLRDRVAGSYRFRQIAMCSCCIGMLLLPEERSLFLPILVSTMREILSGNWGGVEDPIWRVVLPGAVCLSTVSYRWIRRDLLATCVLSILLVLCILFNWITLLHIGSYNGIAILWAIPWFLPSSVIGIIVVASDLAVARVTIRLLAARAAESYSIARDRNTCRPRAMQCIVPRPCPNCDYPIEYGSEQCSECGTVVNWFPIRSGDTGLARKMAAPCCLGIVLAIVSAQQTNALSVVETKLHVANYAMGDIQRTVTRAIEALSETPSIPVPEAVLLSIRNSVDRSNAMLKAFEDAPRSDTEVHARWMIRYCVCVSVLLVACWGIILIGKPSPNQWQVLVIAEFCYVGCWLNVTLMGSVALFRLLENVVRQCLW